MPVDLQTLLAPAALIFALAGIAVIFILRIRSLDRKIDLLFRAAAVHARDLRANSEISEKGFSDLRRADNHRRVLLASLNSQMAQISAMLATQEKEDRSSPTGSRALPHLPVQQVDDGERQVIPGYRLAARRRAAPVVRVDTPEAAQQRKAVQIDAFFRKAGTFASQRLPQDMNEEMEPRRAVNG